MSRKAKDGSNSAKETPVSNKKDVAWGGFIEVRLDDATKSWFEEWLAQQEQGVLELLEAELFRGLKLGISYDPAQDCYLATFTADGFERIGLEHRYCLTARAEDYWRAIALLLFKHIELAQRNWGTYSVKQQQFNRFG